MSMLEKLQIQGIRSFGPKDTDRQMMTFFSPLTLILGSNGTGKTTIIECLRNATTGDLPPGQGKVFVHDPKLNSEIEVNAQIKLKFIDVTGCANVLTRSFMLRQNKATTAFKTVDTALVQYGKDGTRTTATPRCVDVGATVIELLGVPRAILENVIFCHQTDSNWPLSEGQALKTKFDNIFAATQYIKALEHIRKQKIEYTNGVKMMKETIKFLRANKEKADEYEEEVTKSEQRLEDCASTIRDIQDRLEPLSTAWKALEDKMDKERNLQQRLSAEKEQLQYTESEIKRITLNLKDVFAGSEEQLKQEIQNFEVQMLEDKGSLEREKTALQEACSLLGKNSDEHKKLLPALGYLQSEQQAVQETSQKVEAKLERLNKHHCLNVGVTSSDSLKDKVTAVLAGLERKKKETQRRFEDAKQESEEQEKALQGKIDSAREQKSKCEQKLESTRKNIDENSKEIMRIRKELLDAKTYSSQVRELNNEIESFKQEIEAVEGEDTREGLREKIDSSQTLKEEVAGKLDKLNAELLSAQRFSKEQAELDRIRQDIKEKSDVLESLMTENKEKFVELLGTVPTSDIGNRVKEVTAQIESDVSCLRSTVSKLNAKKSSLEAELKMRSEDLRNKESELEKSRKKIVAVCGSEKLDESISDLSRFIEKEREEAGTLSGSLAMYTKYVKSLKAKPCCPLCKRDFREVELAAKLVADLERSIETIPQEAKRKSDEISEKENLFNAMQRLKGDETKMAQLKTHDIPKLKQKIEKLKAEQSSLETQLGKEEEILDSRLFDLAMASSMANEAERIDRLQLDISSLQRSLASKSPRIQQHGSVKSTESILSEIQDLTSQGKMYDKNLHACRSKLEQLHNLDMSLKDAQSAKLRLESKMKEESILHEQKTKLESDSVALKSSLEVLRKELQEHQHRLDKAQKAKSNAASETENLLDRLRSEVSQRALEMEDLRKHFDKIQEYSASGNPQRLQDVKKKLELLKEHGRKLENEKEEKAALVRRLEQGISRQELRERELKDNLHLKELQKKKLQHVDKMEEIRDDMRRCGLGNLDAEKQKILEKIEKLKRDKRTTEIREGELRVKIDAAKKELNGHFKDARKKYTKALTEMHVKDFISKDLDMYYRAVNYAVLKYHEQKMKDINRVIKELWQDTYCGDDIDYIQIRTDTDDKGLESTRRTYNYRVVMVKGKVEQDMRGRCSAGQKVLASLIIRLALAENFCHNCGILALDEPTTNLDRSNIHGLALSLGKIVQARMKQRNFQMIVITHDEEFLRLLSERNGYAEYFYKVEKSDEGCSRLTKCRLSTIM
ncbi:hypothetical protein HPB50_003727 [Hyalomma asiaticum]|uniref:Uncharacterized protein n=1 Tax=Hyalomma asiaticum TaxID=266040 RepID=A0ACB7SE99_HYAAI|nr:hypothetical protein HPB50_003727 [Hyalomma asiaticum]